MNELFLNFIVHKNNKEYILNSFKRKVSKSTKLLSYLKFNKKAFGFNWIFILNLYRKNDFSIHIVDIICFYIKYFFHEAGIWAKQQSHCRDNRQT